MTPVPSPFGSRFARYLAAGLVALALLGNGLAWAQGLPPAARSDCCADEAGSPAGHAKPCDHDGETPAPAQDQGCDDLCLARCQANAALPLPPFPLLMPPDLPARTARMPVGGRSLFDPGPNLRPPISS